MDTYREILGEAAGETRRIEEIADRILGVLPHLEDCQDAEEVRGAAGELWDAIDWLRGCASELDDIARRADEVGEESDE